MRTGKRNVCKKINSLLVSKITRQVTKTITRYQKQHKYSNRNNKYKVTETINCGKELINMEDNKVIKEAQELNTEVVDVQQGSENVDTQNTTQEVKTFTQEEVNRMIEKRLAKQKSREDYYKEFQAELDRQKQEEQRKKTFEEMSAEEKVKELMRQMEENKLETAKKERQNKLTSELLKEGIDEKYISLLNLTDDETAFNSLNTVKELINGIKADYENKLADMVEEAVKERLQGKVKVTSSTGNKMQSYKDMSQAEFIEATKDLTLAEMQEALKERNR